MSGIRALGLGAISGLRSASGPALLGRAAARGDVDLKGSRFAFLAHPLVSKTLLLAMAGELVGDKLPMVPGRTTPAPLLGRAASGALVGAAVSGAGGRGLAGGVLGAGAAVAAAFAGERLRATAGEKTGVPDPLLALVEDAIVLSVGLSLLRSERREV